MDEHIEKYLTRVQGLKSEATHRTTTSNLRQFDIWLNEEEYDLLDIEPLTLELFLIEMANDGYAPNTVASRFESVRALYKFLSGKLGVVEDNPMEDFKWSDHVEKGTKKHDSTDVVYITPEEKELLCEHIPTPTLRNELIIRLLWQTGVRKSELVEIELDDIDREQRSIGVWSNKTKDWRTVYYQPSLDLLMDQWIDGGYRGSFATAAGSPYLFVSERSEQMAPETVNRKIVRPAAENAEIQGLAIHGELIPSSALDAGLAESVDESVGGSAADRPQFGEPVVGTGSEKGNPSRAPHSYRGWRISSSDSTTGNRTRPKSPSSCHSYVEATYREPVARATAP